MQWAPAVFDLAEQVGAPVWVVGDWPTNIAFAYGAYFKHRNARIEGVNPGTETPPKQGDNWTFKELQKIAQAKRKLKERVNK